jgi:Family of unknown function (DUF5372)
MDYQKQSTAPVSLDRAQTFQVTHVFHPLHGRELAFVDQYLAWGEDRVCFRDDTDKLRYLPTDWTSLASPDPFVQASAGRSHFRVEELLQLTTLIALQRQAQAPKSRQRRRRKLNYVQNVKINMSNALRNEPHRFCRGSCRRSIKNGK